MAKEKVNTESFEYSFKKLEKILGDLEENIEERSLDQIIENYQEGLKLLKVCRDKLSEAELKIEKINLDK
ncbi:MAG: exodeoxyribonuclease VII small subunit [Ignavibacteriota bacterium]|nr:exodeoxyribonuclease VII small subunit [Ignavibacteriota bacterium]